MSKLILCLFVICFPHLAGAAESDITKFISLNLQFTKDGLAMGTLDHVLSVCENNHCAAIKRFSTDLTQLENARMKQIVYVSNSLIASSLSALSIHLEDRGVKFILNSKARCFESAASSAELENQQTHSFSVSNCSGLFSNAIEVSATLKQREFAGRNVSAEYASTFKTIQNDVELKQLKNYRIIFATGMSGRWRVFTHALSESLEPRDYFDAILSTLNAQEISNNRILPKIFDDDVDNGELIMDQIQKIERRAAAEGDERPILLVSNSRACNEILDALLEDRFGFLKNGKIKGWLAIQGSFLGTPRVEAGYDVPEIRMAVDLLYKKALYSLTAIARDDFMTANHARIEQLAKRIPIITVVGRIPSPEFPSVRIATYKKLIAENVDNDGSVPSYSETLAGSEYVVITGIDHEGFSAQNNYGFDRLRGFMSLFKMLLSRITR